MGQLGRHSRVQPGGARGALPRPGERRALYGAGRPSALRPMAPAAPLRFRGCGPSGAVPFSGGTETTGGAQSSRGDRRAGGGGGGGQDTLRAPSTEGRRGWSSPSTAGDRRDGVAPRAGAERRGRDAAPQPPLPLTALRAAPLRYRTRCPVAKRPRSRSSPLPPPPGRASRREQSEGGCSKAFVFFYCSS